MYLLSRKSSPASPESHNFADFVRLRWNAWKPKLMYCLRCFECCNAWSSLEQGKKLQYFLFDRVYENLHLKLCLEQGQDFVESAESPYLYSCWVHASPPPPGTAPTTVLTCSPLPFSLFPMGNTFVTNVLVPFSTESSLQTRTVERVVKCGLKPNL